jgi:hypothetical protein
MLVIRVVGSAGAALIGGWLIAELYHVVRTYVTRNR